MDAHTRMKKLEARMKQNREFGLDLCGLCPTARDSDLIRHSCFEFRACVPAFRLPPIVSSCLCGEPLCRLQDPGENAPLAETSIKRLRWNGLDLSTNTLTALDRFSCLASRALLFLAKYPSLLVRKFLQKRRRLRTRLRHHLRLSLRHNLNLNLYPDVDLYLDPNLNLSLPVALRVTLCRSKYLSLFVKKFGQMCLQLRAQLHRKVRRQLDNELRRKLRAQLHAALFGALLARLFETLFEQTFASLFGSMFGSKFRSFLASTCLALRLQLLPPRRSPGRSPHDRIVVCGRRHTIYSGWPRRDKLRSQGGIGPHRRP
jgi:hypothetical protein